MHAVTEALHAVELTLFLRHMPEGVAEHSFLGYNHQSTCMPSYSLYVQLLWYPMYYSGGMKARISPVQWSEPHSILAPTQDSNPGGRIQNHKRWPLHYHCTQLYKYTIGVIASLTCTRGSDRPAIQLPGNVVWSGGSEVRPGTFDLTQVAMRQPITSHACNQASPCAAQPIKHRHAPIIGTCAINQSNIGSFILCVFAEFYKRQTMQKKNSRPMESAGQESDCLRNYWADKLSKFEFRADCYAIMTFLCFNYWSVIDILCAIWQLNNAYGYDRVIFKISLLFIEVVIWLFKLCWLNVDLDFSIEFVVV